MITTGLLIPRCSGPITRRPRSVAPPRGLRSKSRSVGRGRPGTGTTRRADPAIPVPSRQIRTTARSSSASRSIPSGMDSAAAHPISTAAA